jgi:hypothetical protein
MGYGFHYKLGDSETPREVNTWLREQPAYETLEKCGYRIHFWSQEDEDDPDTTNWYDHTLGEGYNNLGPALASNAEFIMRPWAQLFAGLHSRYTVKILSSSCAISTEDAYFTGETLQRVTNNGNALTGDEIETVKSQLP